MEMMIKQLSDTDSQCCTADSCTSKQTHFHLGQWNTPEREYEFRQLFDESFVNGATIHLRLSKWNLIENLICHFVRQTVCYKRKNVETDPTQQWVLDRDWLLAKIGEIEAAFDADKADFIGAVFIEQNNLKRIGLRSIKALHTEGGVASINLQELMFSGDSIKLSRDGRSFELSVINGDPETAARVAKWDGVLMAKCLLKYPDQESCTVQQLVSAFKSEYTASGLRYSESLVNRFVCALMAKPFLVLTGLSGSGKTKLAQAFTNWVGTATAGVDGCFYPGLIIHRSNTDLTIISVDTVGLVVEQGNGARTALSHELIDQYVESIGIHGENVTKQLVMSDHPNLRYSPTMHMFDSTLLPLAQYKLQKRVPCMSSFKLVPVGADWTNSEKLLGYPNALDPKKYVMPDTGVLKLMLDARDNPRLPFFLILDEMNLSHVERYFADFLSAMESGDEIKLYDGADRTSDDGTQIPQRLAFPKNLFVIGTMNVDETTYMFSPKVLDRAQVIEFRVSKDEMASFLDAPTTPNLDAIAGKGARYAEAFLQLKNTPPALDAQGDTKNKNAINKVLTDFFVPLAKLGSEFGYRTAGEVVRFCAYALSAGLDQTAAIDAAIVQKLLPKLHGSQQRLAPVLRALKDLATKEVTVLEDGESKKKRLPVYPLTCEKLDRMLERVKANGFTSFAEA